MRFGKTLREAAYEPWRDRYMDYGKLKGLLREDGDNDDDEAWTEEDEKRFCDEIFNVQLERVARFQQQSVNGLRQRVDAAFDRLRELAPPVDHGGGDGHDDDGDGGGKKPQQPKHVAAAYDDKDDDKEHSVESRLRVLEGELDAITNEVRELKRYSSINYTGFLKIVKKHDRKRGNRYRVRPMMQLSLAQRPFNSEQAYSPLLNKLSIMYFAIRQQLEGSDQAPLDLESQSETHNGERYTAHKFWVHPDNLLEVKTLILRRLPSLVYSEQSAKELDGKDSPAITSLYFDSPKYQLYADKVHRQSEASTLRLRWSGQLSARPDIYFEQKTADAQGNSQERRFAVKDKWIQPLLAGENPTDKHTQKMARQGVPADHIDGYKATVAGMQDFVRRRGLAPVLRASYVRTAFQKPADDWVRVAIDTDLAFVREDALDADRPCRDPGD